MAISNECRAKHNKQVNVFNEMQKANQAIQKVLNFAAQEIDANNPHAAVKDEALFVKTHSSAIGELVDSMMEKCAEIKTAFA